MKPILVALAIGAATVSGFARDSASAIRAPKSAPMKQVGSSVSSSVRSKTTELNVFGHGEWGRDPVMLWSTANNSLQNKVLIDELSKRRSDESVKLLETSNEDEMVEALADAFVEDPMLVWCAQIPDNVSDLEKKTAQLDFNRWMVRGLNGLVLSRKRGVTLGVMEGNQMAGSMSLVPSSCNPPQGVLDWLIYAFFKGGMPPNEKKETKKNYGPLCQARTDAISVLAKKRKDTMKPYPKHIYLQQIGVRGEFQGKGIGGKLFRTLFAAADSLRVPVYLETESKENETLYHHYGFQTIETPVLSAKGDTSVNAKFKVYIMVRQPR